MTAPAPRLEAVGVTCAYDGRPVLEGLDLALPAGRLVALLGGNGAGKTTALRALGRLMRPVAGKVLYEGRELWDLEPRWCARRIGYVAQVDRVFGPVTVEQVASLGRAPHRGWFRPLTGHDRRVVEEALERLGLTDLRHRTLDTLSGGERRRALIARALVQEAEVLLLDEPTAHLDLRHQVEMLELLVELAHRQGIAVAASFHDLNLAALYADRAALLRDGRLAACGAVERVMTPDVLRRVYGLDVEVNPHPATGRPTVLPVRAGDRAAPAAEDLEPMER